MTHWASKVTVKVLSTVTSKTRIEFLSCLPTEEIMQGNVCVIRRDFLSILKSCAVLVKPQDLGQIDFCFLCKEVLSSFGSEMLECCSFYGSKNFLSTSAARFTNNTYAGVPLEQALQPTL